jgi:PAS domain-containing protein
MNIQKQKTILLVEEEGISATDEARALKKNGYRVIRVHRGENAIAAIQNSPEIDLVLMKERQKEEALHQAHERLALAQRAAGAGIWDWDLTTEKLEWSPELFKLFGLDPATAVADFETWRGVLHPQDRDAAEDRVSAALRDHRRLEVEYRFVLPSGETRWISAIRPFRPSGGFPPNCGPESWMTSAWSPPWNGRLKSLPTKPASPAASGRPFGNWP